MKSPFPGVDPYLEDPAFWREFHMKFVNCWQEQIAEVLPDDYEARLGENVYLCEETVEIESKREPDVMVMQSRERKRRPIAASGGLATLAPEIIPLVLDVEFIQAHIKLIHRQSRTVVAVLEMLSPANKREPGKSQYWAKRNELFQQDVPVIELDMLLGGARVPLVKPLPQGDYYYLMSRGNRRPDCQVYHWNLGDSLPRMPVPLQAPDADIVCDLGKVYTITYERGRYHKVIEYHKLPHFLKLTSAQKKWIRQRTRGSRAGGAT